MFGRPVVLALATVLSLAGGGAARAEPTPAGRSFSWMGTTWCLGYVPVQSRCDIRIPPLQGLRPEGATNDPMATLPRIVTARDMPARPAPSPDLERQKGLLMESLHQSLYGEPRLPVTVLPAPAP